MAGVPERDRIAGGSHGDLVQRGSALPGIHFEDENFGDTLDARKSFDPDGASEPLTYEWDTDNDGVFEQTGIEANFGYRDLPGDYPVTLHVTDQYGASSTVTDIMRVRDTKPQLAIYYPKYVMVGTSPNFGDGYFRRERASQEDQCVIDWDLNYDGVTFDSDVVKDNIRFNFDHAGKFQFAARVTDDDGDSTITVINVTAIEHTSVMNVVAPTTVQAGQPFSVTAHVVNDEVPSDDPWFSWFNYRGSSQAGGPTFPDTFEEAGTYTMELTGYTSIGEKFTYSQQIVVTPRPVVPPGPAIVVISTDDSQETVHRQKKQHRPAKSVVDDDLAKAAMPHRVYQPVMTSALMARAFAVNPIGLWGTIDSNDQLVN